MKSGDLIRCIKSYKTLFDISIFEKGVNYTILSVNSGTVYIELKEGEGYYIVPKGQVGYHFENIRKVRYEKLKMLQSKSIFL